MEDQFKARTMKRKNVKGLALSAPPKPAAPSDEDAQLPGALGNDGSRADTLEIGVEFRFDLRGEDLEMLKELGAGNGGTVSKVRHAGWNVVMARKIIHVEAKKEVRRRIIKELQIMHECNSPYIVSFYGAFMNESGDVTMCMEYMDVGSLDSISKTFGPVRVDVLGKIAEAVLGGLKYLYLAHRIMHRDIKPSNVLVNSRGQIKLCDFGVSSELENSVADTFVGTGTYMAPERIQGSPYTVKSDVWSVGLTLMELAIGKFPFGTDNDDEDAAGPQSILDLLQQIVLEPAPKLPKSDAFPQILEDVIAKCMMKNPEERPTPQELYDTDPFLQAAKRTPVDLEQWAVSMMERQHRKSHLAPQLSPATRALLRGADTPGSPPTSAQQQSHSEASTPFERTPISDENVPFSSASSNGSAFIGGSGGSSMRSYPARTTSAQGYSGGSGVSSSSTSGAGYAAGQQMNLPIRQQQHQPPLSATTTPAAIMAASTAASTSMPPPPSAGARRIDRDRERERDRPDTAGSDRSEGFRRVVPASASSVAKQGAGYGYSSSQQQQQQGGYLQ